MRLSNKWQDYELIDCSCGERLERWGDIILIRPDPQVIWQTRRDKPLWQKADARYIRSASGGGHWETYKKIPDFWTIGYGNCRFNIKTMGFKHTGIFPEQAVNWDYTSGIIRGAGREVRLLNLFAYTGAATVSALAAGASVTHVDASKGMVAWAKENAAASGVAIQECNAQNKLQSRAPQQNSIEIDPGRIKNVRWLVDDCVKFVEREIRRGSKYDIIIMDPPSYGRGPGGEVWKLEDEIYKLCSLCAELLPDRPLMFMINSYTAGLSPAVMKYILSHIMLKNFGGGVEADELGLPVNETGLVLPCGSTAIWTSVRKGKQSDG